MRNLVKQFLRPRTVCSGTFRQCTVRLSSNKKNKNDEAVDEIKIKRNIIVDKYGGIVTLSIDRHATRNSLDEITLREIEEALDAFEKDDDSKVFIFHGEGGSFCSGYDFDELEAKGYNTLFDASKRLRARPLSRKVTVAAVSGFAVAEGFELALACDLRVVEDTAVLGCLGRRFGVPLGLYGARRLTALIGLSPALDLIITGRLINGTEANQKGLVCKLTSTGTALGEAVKLAKSLVKFPQSALTMDRMAAVNSQLPQGTDESLRDEAIAQSLLGQAVLDMQEGVRKFQKGIGKHGKFYKLTEMPLRDWEVQREDEEVVLKVEQSASEGHKKAKADKKKPS